MFAFMEHIPGCADWVGCYEAGVSQSLLFLQPYFLLCGVVSFGGGSLLACLYLIQ